LTVDEIHTYLLSPGYNASGYDDQFTNLRSEQNLTPTIKYDEIL
jgi:hypothetical protein